MAPVRDEYLTLATTEKPKKITIKMKPAKAFTVLILIFFFIGLSIGACSLGMKLPVALYELATSPR